ncbi:phosphonopyruvate decarboxylase [Paracoccaceae bacterium]|nr:phosphonopyruvate decarboxylase [Paracoccaceae bacterium]
MMLEPAKFLSALRDQNVNFFCGVPDSLLKDFCACVTSTLSADKHMIAANEGAAVGLAIGRHIACDDIPLVYMQNSGLGNAINPLISLASNDIYGVPMLVMIGWRGEPGKKDEPQHVHQGRVMYAMIEAMEFASVILSDDLEAAIAQIKNAAQLTKETASPVFIIIQKGTFESFSMDGAKSELLLTREQAIIEIVKNAPKDAVFVSTTGMPSRELFEYRARSEFGHAQDFLTVGGMGHASQIALGLALNKPEKAVICLDGDGAALMRLGSLAISGQKRPGNLTPIILNNGAHASVGGQPIVGLEISFTKIADGCGYKQIKSVRSTGEIAEAMNSFEPRVGSGMLEIQVLPGNRTDIGRPTTTPRENILALKEFVHG